MDTFIDRLKSERNTLGEKYEKLIRFTTTPMYEHLTFEHRELLRRQADYMEGYFKVLTLRIDKLMEEEMSEEPEVLATEIEETGPTGDEEVKEGLEDDSVDDDDTPAADVND